MDREQYTAELARILREILTAGSARDRDKMLELASDLEQLAFAAGDG
ncbi:unnamed protein product [marine sediment metagenome]|uniref:Uncharacterized protein n=1 Tax=marine sediment metagenome TaxID=412755 RepID=X1TTT5_9ZZZZ